MKIKNIIGLLLFPVAFIACGDDSDITPNPPVPEIVTEPTVLTTPSVSEYVLSSVNPGQEAFKLTWDPDIHRLESPSFDVQIDISGNNFAGAKVLGSTSANEYSVTAENLDTVIVKLLDQNINKSGKYDIRVVTKQGATGIASSASNTFTVTVTPYSGYPSELYLAVKGADISAAPQFTNLEEGIFELIVNLKNGDEYKFVQVKELDKAYEYVASSTTVNTEANITIGASGVYSPIFEGSQADYRILVDFTKMTTTVEYSVPANLYLVGTINSWDVENAPAFTKVSDGVFEIVYDLNPDDVYKYVQIQDWTMPDFISSSTVVDQEAELLPGNGSNSPAFAGTAGSYKIKVDFNTMTTLVTSALPENLYLTGDAYIDWVWGEDDFQLIPVNGTPGVFWAVLYLEAGGFKFSPIASWDDNFGINETNTDAIGDYTIKAGGNNINVTTAGIYQILVNYGAGTISITTPKVVLKGPAASANWDATFLTDPFTISITNPKEMISPVFDESGDLRMFVEISGYDWWKCEFIVRNGNIEYRGNGGDQEPRVQATAGGKVTLDFNAGTGVIE